MHTGTNDHEVIAAINRRTGVALTVVGRAQYGELGGAIYVAWPDGRPAVVTRFLGPLAEARRTAELLAHVRDRGLPVPRHDLVVELDDGVAFVQERLPSGPSRPLTAARVDALVEINDRFADALADRSDVPAPVLGVGDGVGVRGGRAREVIAELRRIAEPFDLTGGDLVHVDLTAANVLFDERDRATGVVDWNLGAFRGDRLFALVKTRFDREWFVRSPDADPVETAAAAHLDEILADRIAPDTLRRYWARWMLFQLSWTVPAGAVGWHLDLAESRIG